VQQRVGGVVGDVGDVELAAAAGDRRRGLARVRGDPIVVSWPQFMPSVELTCRSAFAELFEM